MAARHLKTGKAGEDAAAAHLRKKGFSILARNWRHGSWELDIICRDGDVLVFVEVKTRDADGMAAPADGLTPAKQGRLAKAAGLFLTEHQLWDAPCRFDLVSVSKSRRGLLPSFAVEHVENAFQVDMNGAAGPGYQPF